MTSKVKDIINMGQIEMLEHTPFKKVQLKNLTATEELNEDIKYLIGRNENLIILLPRLDQLILF